MDMQAIVAKVNPELAGCRIIPAGPGWGGERWLVEDMESGLCKRIPRQAIIAIAMERYLLPDRTMREHLSKAGSAKSERKARTSRENGKKGGRPRTRKQ
jgi:hypothetical protein